MSSRCIAIGFSNCLGNYLIMTAALKILRKRSDTKIFMLTDEDTLSRHPAVEALAKKMFDGVVTKYSKHEFDRIYVGDWSRPTCMIKKGDIAQKAVWWTTQSPYSGMHEIQVYLDMINASSADFDGFLTEIADKPQLTGKKPRIVLANASVCHGSRQGSKVGWDKFVGLSKALQDLDYDVILVGQGDELKDCVGLNFVDELNIFETAKVISQCDLMVASDTGLMHLADSLGVPLVVLAGPTPMTKTHPLVSKYKIVRKFVSCAPCYQSKLWSLCNDPVCMKNIKVDDVLKTVFSFNLKKGIIKSVTLPSFMSEGTTFSRRCGKQSIKIVMPYYGGEERIDAAVKTWPTDVLLLAITDENTKPPAGYESFFTSDNAKKRGLSNKTKPMSKDIFQKLLELYPNEDFYGYVNSDIVLPPNVTVEALFPSKAYKVAVHHRLDVQDITDKRGSIYHAGKDCFVWSTEVARKIVVDYPELVLGSCCWDDGLVFWLWQLYGKDAIELRYGEIRHKLHKPGWTANDTDGRFNNAALEAVGVSTTLRYSYDWLAQYKDWQKTVKKIGIIQPGRIGDILIVLPIAKWYADKGFEVLWPIHEEYLPLFDYIDYVTPIVINKALHLCYEESKKLLQDKVIEVIDLGIGFGRDEQNWIKSSLTFDEWKYVEANVPFEERQNLQIIRNPERERDLQKELSLKKPYRLKHSFGHSLGKFDFKIDDAVEIKAVEDFTLFDWISIIENADEVLCINSCVMNLIEGLKINVKKSLFLQSDVCKNNRDMLLIPHLKEDWSMVDKNQTLPVAFFTIVFDGMPFIKYHLENFKRLNFSWHWYIIEGLSQVAGDSGSQDHKRRGGHIAEKFTSHLSSDGTTEYLDEVSDLDNVTVIRKDAIWDSKLEMINSCLPFIHEPCLLWQIDVDEFYPVPVLMRLHRMFIDNPEKTAAAPFLYSFLSKKKYIVSEDTWGSRRYARIWRYDLDHKWISHEPPVLATANGSDLMKINPFNADELADLRYYHYNYVTKEQIQFKETYYGYKGLFLAWSALQKQPGRVKISDYFPWKGFDNLAFADNFHGRHIIPIEKTPVHFFTLVWNGMPFIKHHLSVFEKLSFDWHWHIIEGPAHHGQDIGSQQHQSRGGSVPEDVVDDGTLAYLEKLSKNSQITIYPRQDWKGKVDMADAPLKNINERCILWQVDSDELYSVELLEKAYRVFMSRPDKNVGILSMFQFVGPNKYVIPLAKYDAFPDTWGNLSYPRLWRYKPGLKWLSHAPPVMSLEKTNSFKIDVSFYHYSYVYEKQIEFKSSYYGYESFISKWKRLQEIKGKVKLGQFFPWLKDSQVTVNDWQGKHLITL